MKYMKFQPSVDAALIACFYVNSDLLKTSVTSLIHLFKYIYKSHDLNANEETRQVNRDNLGAQQIQALFEYYLNYLLKLLYCVCVCLSALCQHAPVCRRQLRACILNECARRHRLIRERIYTTTTSGYGFHGFRGKSVWYVHTNLTWMTCARVRA